MRFHDGVVGATFAGVPIVGNLDNGQVVGLDAAGEKLCERLFAGDVSQEDALASNAVLVEHLEQRGFFKRQESLGITHAYVHVTQRCNLHCEGCYSLDAERNAAPDPSLDDVIQELEELRREMALPRKTLGGYNKRYAPRARVNRPRIYR